MMGWPPVKEGMSSDEIRLVGQNTAPLTENVIKVVQGFDVFIGNRLVG
jgi:hypothetical protein